MLERLGIRSQHASIYLGLHEEDEMMPLRSLKRRWYLDLHRALACDLHPGHAGDGSRDGGVSQRLTGVFAAKNAGPIGVVRQDSNPIRPLSGYSPLVEKLTVNVFPPTFMERMWREIRGRCSSSFWIAFENAARSLPTICSVPLITICGV